MAANLRTHLVEADGKRMASLATSDVGNGLHVLKVMAVDEGGSNAAGAVATLTPVLDTDAYAANDVLFVPIEVENVFAVAGGCRALHSIVVLDGDDQGVDIDLVFMNADGELGTINSAVSISDADAAKILGAVSLVAEDDAIDLVNSRLYTKTAVGLVLEAAAGSTSLWVAGIVRSGTPTFTASGMQIRLGFI